MLNFKWFPWYTCYIVYFKLAKCFLFSLQAQDMVVKKYPHLKNVRMLKPDDIAEAVMYAVTQPSYVAVNEVLVQPADL